MEVELEPRVKALPFKVKAMSRESPSQKALHVLDTDLRTHWSTATNTKEWILLELDEPCLLSHIRIYNKSVLEWEIVVGLRYKIQEELNKMEADTADRQLSQQEMMIRKQLQEDLWMAAQSHESLLRQKARSR
ncbi:hypothetical protein D0Y65_017645 [Glycine soja]|uniref:DNA-repair protein Xrcc1 N-terminal domain-containing protein n=1 Tax=Glycine soja TaxID=3848 RepID=A0A445JVS0_GLYSO|nr:hypothetical protein D0Y65_017645 [Glycine soja]